MIELPFIISFATKFLPVAVRARQNVFRVARFDESGGPDRLIAVIPSEIFLQPLCARVRDGGVRSPGFRSSH